MKGIQQFLSNPWTSIDIQDERGLTPLARAALALQSSAVEYLLWNGADPRITFKDQNNVHHGIIPFLVKTQSRMATEHLEDDQSHKGIQENSKEKDVNKGLSTIRDPESYHCALKIAKAILHDFPECKLYGSLLQGEMGSNKCEDLRMMVKQLEEFEFGSYQPIDGWDQNLHWTHLDFAVAFSCMIPRQHTVQNVVEALRNVGVPASVVARSAAEVSKHLAERATWTLKMFGSIVDASEFI